MPDQRVASLEDCCEYRQTLLARPPALTHGTLLVLMLLLAAAVTWASLTEADLVVRAKGRVRPMTRANRVADSADEESTVAPLAGGRVVEVHAREGQRVRQGDLLIKFDDRQLTYDIARHERTIEAAEAELAKLREMEQLQDRRYATSQAKAQAELSEAQRDLEIQQQRRETEIEIAEVQLTTCKDAYQRARALHERAATTSQEVMQAKSSFHEARLKLQNAQLPLDDSKLTVLRQALELVERDYLVQRSELENKRALKVAEIDAARLELSSLRLQREQTRLTAPCDGIVTAVKAKVGDVVEAGKPALLLVDQHGFRLDVDVAAGDVAHLREGMPVRVKLDAYDFQKYGTATGKVVFISPDSRVPESENGRSAPVYTVKVALDNEFVGRGDDRGPIKLGMTGQAEILTSKERILLLLVRSIRQSISLG